jgi:trigger factor
MVRARVGDALHGEFLKRALPKAYLEALEETRLSPAGEPEIKDLEFRQGEPLRFKAHLEAWPNVEITGYRELALIRNEFEVTDEDVDKALKVLRERRAAFDPVDRPAQGGDLVACEYWLLNELGERGEMRTSAVEVGGAGTPEPFTKALAGACRGESRRVILPASSHAGAEGVHEHPEQVLDLIVKEVREIRLPPLDETFARGVMDKEDATLDDVKGMIRRSLEIDEAVRSMENLEEALFDEIIARNSFDLPEGAINATLNDIAEKARRDGPLSEEEEREIKTAYLPAVERRLRIDHIVEAVARQEGVTVTGEEVDREVARLAERHGKQVAEVRGLLKRSKKLDRLAEEMLRHKVTGLLLSAAKVDVIKKRR